MKDKILKVLFIISILPYIVILFLGINAAFSGSNFLGSTTYGWSAFSFIVLILVVILALRVPIIPICLIFQICCILGYILRKKVEKFKDINSAEYIIIWSVIGCILFIIWFTLMGIHYIQ